MSTEREMRAFLRKLVRQGWQGLNAHEQQICWFCGADAEYVRRPVHRDGCLYVRAKELLATEPKA